MRKLTVKMDGQLAVLAVEEKGSYAGAGKLLSMTGSAVRKQVESISRELAPRFSGVQGESLYRLKQEDFTFRTFASQSATLAWVWIKCVHT